MPTAYDYSSSPIDAAALEAVHVNTVIRYVSTPGNPKNITPTEYRALTEAGITVGLVYETSADWMLGGYGAGFAAARTARAQASAVGYPATRRLWYAADFDASTVQLGMVLGALRGCADAEGSAALVAVYGGYAVVEAATAAGYAAPWQTVAWSGGRISPAAMLYQNGRTTTCGGVEVDINDIYGALFPAPQPPAPSAPLSEEDEMIDRSDSAGVAGFSWSSGTKHVIQVTSDGGIAPKPSLRVVLLFSEASGKQAIELYSAQKPFSVSPNGVGVIRIPGDAVTDAAGVVLEETVNKSTVKYWVYAG